MKTDANIDGDAMTLHIYKTEQNEWFAAESLEDAYTVAYEWYKEQFIGLSDAELRGMLENVKQEPDDEVITFVDEDGLDDEEDRNPPESKTWAEWAEQHGRGFVTCAEA